MKFNFKAIAVVVGCGVVFNAGAQINLLSNGIIFRSSTNYAATTKHYGDIDLTYTPDSNWGWVYTNRLEDYGDAYINGDLYVNGAKNFVQPHPTDTTKVIKYIAVEAGEATTMARGLSKTNGGSVVITLPEHFALVTSGDAPLTVLLTPEKAPVLLYTAEKSKERITVAMKPADFSEFGDAGFAWQLSGVRDGYENEKVICDADSLVRGIGDAAPVFEKRAKMNERARKLMEKCREITKKKK